MSDKFTISLTEEDFNYIIESLLFSSSINIGSDWDETDCFKMFQIAKDLKSNTDKKLNLEKLTFFKEENYEDSLSNDVYQEFKDNLQVFSLETV